MHNLVPLGLDLMREQDNQVQVRPNHQSNGDFLDPWKEQGKFILASNQERFSCFIGNLTWWTTDEDIVMTLKALDVENLLDLKFWEKQSNGLSRGFCMATVGSILSLKKIYDKLPHVLIHGQHPLVTAVNKTNLTYFEREEKVECRVEEESESESQVRPPPPMNEGQKWQQQAQMQRYLPYRPYVQPPPPQAFGFTMYGCGFEPPRRPCFPIPWAANHQPNRYYTPRPPLTKVPFSPVLPPGSTPPTTFQKAESDILRKTPSPPLATSTPPAPYINTQFSRMRKLNEKDIEEALCRNQAVTSSAISRAVSDAAAGDYDKGMETLETAISILRKSGIRQDKRVEVLIESLHDILHGIRDTAETSDRKHGRSRRREEEWHEEHYSRRSHRSKSRSHGYESHRSRQHRDSEYPRDYHHRQSVPMSGREGSRESRRGAIQDSPPFQPSCPSNHS